MALTVTPTDEMKTLTVGNKIYEVVDDEARTDIANVKADINDVLIKWNIIDYCTILDKTYDNNGIISTNSTFYTCTNIPVTAGQVYYAYSVYPHTSSAYNHKVRKVNFYDANDTFLSSLDYVNTWTIPSNAVKMSVAMAYINNDYSNGRSLDDYITIYTEGSRINHLVADLHLSDGNIPEGFIAENLLATALQNKINKPNSWNAVSTGTILENTFIRTDGTQVTSTSFYTVKDIDVTEGQVWYAFNAYLGGSRFVTFYDSNGTALSGYEYIKSWVIPSNAVKMSVTFNYTNGVKSSRDYITYQLCEIIDEIQNRDKKYENREARIATINFQFDDGDTKDANIFNIFNNNGIPCGFALISNISTARVPEYLMYQRNGFEILSHSTDGAGMSSASLSANDVESKLKTSKKVLESYGFNVRGWVTPYSEMNVAFIPLMAKYYDYGTTVYFGEYDGTGTPYQEKTAETTKLFRVSLQSTTLENQKNAVDAVIANGGFLTFYGHSADLDTTDNETTANLNSLLSYINSKKSDLQCMVLKPSDAIDYYFHVRHSDYLELVSN